MAKTATAAGADKPKKKKKKDANGAKVARRAVGKSDKGGKKHRKSEGFEGLAKFVDHPLIADLLAAGAMAAVAAIAEHRSSDGKRESSSKMVKSVGKAAAAAMGRKLMGDIGSVACAATNAAKKA